MADVSNSSFARTTALLRRAPVARRIALLLAAVTIYAVTVTVIGTVRHDLAMHFEPDLHTFAGFILGLLLVFRTNTAYERWWEARKLWGQLVNESRNLTVKVTRLMRLPAAEAGDFCRSLVGFAQSLGRHLQSPRQGGKLASDSTGLELQQPAEFVGRLYDKVKLWSDENLLSGFDLLVLDTHLRALTDIQGGCDRICKAPIALSYRAFVRQCVLLYLITLPWCLIHSYGLWTVPATIIISYFMIGIEVIAETVEQPFGQSVDHIPLDEICSGIEESIRSILASQAQGVPADAT